MDWDSTDQYGFLLFFFGCTKYLIEISGFIENGFIENGIFAGNGTGGRKEKSAIPVLV